jgi:hypothetical protein
MKSEININDYINNWELERKMLEHDNYRISEIGKVNTITFEVFNDILKIENVERPVMLCYNFYSGDLKVLVR